MRVSRVINALLEHIGLKVVRLKSSKSKEEKDICTVACNLPKKDTIQRREHELSNSNLAKKIVRHQISLTWRVLDQIEAGAEKPTNLECPLCGAMDKVGNMKEFHSDCMFGGGRLIRHQCKSCELIFGPQKMLDMNHLQLSQEYDTHYQVYEEGDSSEAEERTFHELKPRKGGVYLNFGAGAWSNSLNNLNEQGWKVYGYEPHAQTGPSPHLITSESELESMRFDGIFSNNVLEHFREPAEELKKMSRLLKPGGQMAHTTPCFEYLYPFTRFHLFFFLGESSKILARKADLKIERIERDGEYMCMVLSKEGL